MFAGQLKELLKDVPDDHLIISAIDKEGTAFQNFGWADSNVFAKVLEGSIGEFVDAAPPQEGEKANAFCLFPGPEGMSMIAAEAPPEPTEKETAAPAAETAEEEAEAA